MYKINQKILSFYTLFFYLFTVLFSPSLVHSQVKIIKNDNVSFITKTQQPSWLASLAQDLSSSRSLTQSAIDNVTSKTSQTIERWLNHYGTAQVGLNYNSYISSVEGGARILLPFKESLDHTVFTELGFHNTNHRWQTNIGVGFRKFQQNAMFGVNGFFDSDLSRSNSRLGLGLEYWANYLRLSTNYYHPLTGWHQSKGNAEFLEKTAKGFDIQAQAFVPSMPQLGINLAYSKYYGNVNFDNRAFSYDTYKKDPSSYLIGLDYTPVPLFTVNAGYKMVSGLKGSVNLGLKTTYRFGVPVHEQMDPNAVNYLRTLKGGRYDFVNRENNIVLEHKASSTDSVKKGTAYIKLKEKSLTAHPGSSGAEVEKEITFDYYKNDSNIDVPATSTYKVDKKPYTLKDLACTPNETGATCTAKLVIPFNEADYENDIRIINDNAKIKPSDPLKIHYTTFSNAKIIYNDKPIISLTDAKPNQEIKFSYDPGEDKTITAPATTSFELSDSKFSLSDVKEIKQTKEGIRSFSGNISATGASPAAGALRSVYIKNTNPKIKQSQNFQVSYNSESAAKITTTDKSVALDKKTGKGEIKFTFDPKDTGLTPHNNSYKLDPNISATTNVSCSSGSAVNCTMEITLTDLTKPLKTKVRIINDNKDIQKSEDIDLTFEPDKAAKITATEQSVALDDKGEGTIHFTFDPKGTNKNPASNSFHFAPDKSGLTNTDPQCQTNNSITTCEMKIHWSSLNDALNHNVTIVNDDSAIEGSEQIHLSFTPPKVKIQPKSTSIPLGNDGKGTIEFTVDPKDTQIVVEASSFSLKVATGLTVGVASCTPRARDTKIQDCQISVTLKDLTKNWNLQTTIQSTSPRISESDPIHLSFTKSSDQNVIKETDVANTSSIEFGSTTANAGSSISTLEVKLNLKSDFEQGAVNKLKLIWVSTTSEATTFDGPALTWTNTNKRTYTAGKPTGAKFPSQVGKYYLRLVNESKKVLIQAENPVQLNQGQ